MRSEEAHGHVAPVVFLLRIELEDGHQLDRGHAQIDEMGNLIDHAQKCAPPLRGDAGVGIVRKAPHVHFINHQIAFVAEPAVAVPLERAMAFIQDGHGGRPTVDPGRCAAVRSKSAGKKSVWA